MKTKGEVIQELKWFPPKREVEHEIQLLLDNLLTLLDTHLVLLQASIISLQVAQVAQVDRFILLQGFLRLIFLPQGCVPGSYLELHSSD